MAADLTATHGTQLDSGILLRNSEWRRFSLGCFVSFFYFFKNFIILGCVGPFFAVHGLSLDAASRRYYLVAVHYFGL